MVQLVPYIYLMEYEGFSEWYKTESSMSSFFVINFTGFLAIFLNFASFKFNQVPSLPRVSLSAILKAMPPLSQVSSALTVTIAGNAKQAITIILGAVLFHTPINVMNVTGVSVRFLPMILTVVNSS